MLFSAVFFFGLELSANLFLLTCFFFVSGEDHVILVEVDDAKAKVRL